MRIKLNEQQIKIFQLNQKLILSCPQKSFPKVVVQLQNNLLQTSTTDGVQTGLFSQTKVQEQCTEKVQFEFSLPKQLLESVELDLYEQKAIFNGNIVREMEKPKSNNWFYLSENYVQHSLGYEIIELYKMIMLSTEGRLPKHLVLLDFDDPNEIRTLNMETEIDWKDKYVKPVSKKVLVSASMFMIILLSLDKYDTNVFLGLSSQRDHVLIMPSCHYQNDEYITYSLSPLF